MMSPEPERSVPPMREPLEHQLFEGAQAPVESPSAGIGTPPRSGLQEERRLRSHRDQPLFFRAELQPDGLYRVVMTEEGLQCFETALGIARDVGSRTPISTYSTLADLMERTATREELSEVMREADSGLLRAMRLVVLERMMWGSEEPSPAARTFGHLGKMIVVGLVLLWTLLQFWTSIMDIAAIPGILANIPSDILHLHPTSSISEVGDKISDAGTHLVYGVLGVCLTYLVARIIKPFERIYRHDQIIAGERALLRAIAALLRRMYRRMRRASRAA